MLQDEVLERLTAPERELVYAALEACFDPARVIREAGLAQLLALDAHRRSALVAASLAMLVVEEDIALRVELVVSLGALFHTEPGRPRASPEIYACLRTAMSHWAMPQVIALLEVARIAPHHRSTVQTLLESSPRAGEYVLQVVLERGAELSLRSYAVQLLGAMGFLAAKPELERMYRRIGMRHANQLRMPFASSVISEADALLPALREALDALAEADD